MRLYEFGHQFKNGPCVSTQIELGLARLDLCPLGHADHTHILNDLGYSFSCCFDQKGNISDINRAIELFQTRLVLCPLGHPEHAEALEGLAVCLWKHYCIQKNIAELNRIIEMQQMILDLCPLGHSHHATALGELGTYLSERYHMEGEYMDLNMAIEMGEKRLNLCPTGHPHHHQALGNLAVSLNTRYHKQGNLADLNRAIYLQEKKLELCPPGHHGHGHALQNLAMFLKDHFKVGKNYSDLIRAIKLFKEALATYSVQHRHFAFITGQLAATILLSSKSTHKSHPPGQSILLPDEAFATYRLLKECGPAVSLNMWNATQAWIQDAEKHNHSSVLEAYQTSLKTLDHFTSLNASLDMRHKTVQARMADLANNAFSCAIRLGDFWMAVELFEQGRGILWNQFACLNTSTTALESRGNRGRELLRIMTSIFRYSISDHDSRPRR